MDYKIELDTFRGPLDLLLFLVKRNEVDIADIPIAKIAEQFLAYLNVLELVDVEWAGEFLVMAATLMEIKSRLLLPRAEEGAAADEDPRLELVKQLIEYKKYKEAAALLEEQAERQMTRAAAQALGDARSARPGAAAVAARGVVGPGQRVRSAHARDRRPGAAPDRHGRDPAPRPHGAASSPS